MSCATASAPPNGEADSGSTRPVVSAGRVGTAVLWSACEASSAVRAPCAPADAIALGNDTDVAAHVATLDALAVQKGWVRRAADELE